MANRCDGGDNTDRDSGKRDVSVQLDASHFEPRARGGHADERHREPNGATRIHTATTAYCAAANHTGDRSTHYTSDRSDDHPSDDDATSTTDRDGSVDII